MNYRIKTSNEAPVEVIGKEYMHKAFADGCSLAKKINGHLPTMGWNSWNAFGTGNNEALTKAMCEKLVELGLDKLGYRYVVLDDGCYDNNRADKKIKNNEERFPGGFRALADYIHSKGLKFGMYNDVGSKLCSGLEVGTCGYEDIDARSYVDWDIDFLKVDNCYYLWDNATFSNAENARYTFAPCIKSVRLKNSTEEIILSGRDAVILGTIATLTEDGVITGLGTFDGTGPFHSPCKDESSEAIFSFEAQEAGEYDLYITYATGKEEGVGEWLQVFVNDADGYAYDALLKPTAGKEIFTEEKLTTLTLKKGANSIKLMNHRRQENTLQSYAAMFYALKEYSDKDIFLSICEWGKTNPQEWGYKVGNSWRILNDITFNVGHDGDPGGAQWTSDYTNSITSQYNKAVIMDEYAGLEKGWNDPDMLVVGMNGITVTQMQTHMVMWCMMNAPLMLGLDLRNVKRNDDIYKIIANADLIALNQDTLGIQAKRIFTTISDEAPDKTYITNNDRVDVLYKPLANGDFALSFINVSDKEFSGVKVFVENKDADSEYIIKDLITKSTLNHKGNEFVCEKLAPYDSYTIRVSKNVGREDYKI